MRPFCAVILGSLILLAPIKGVSEYVRCLDESFDCNWFVSADALYWRALNNGIGCGCDGIGLDHAWAWGYRIGVQNDFDCGWEINADWTHFNTRRDERDEGNHGSWKIDYDVVDLTVGQNFFVNSCLSLKTAMGIRGARIDQHVRSNTFFSQDCSFDDEIIHSITRDDESFRGIGPTANLLLFWHWDCSWVVFGNLGVGLLYGNFANRSEGTEIFTALGDTCFCHEKKNRQAIQYVADAALGVEWEGCVCNRTLLKVKLAWEHHHYFNFGFIGDKYDLCLDGPTISARVSF